MFMPDASRLPGAKAIHVLGAFPENSCLFRAMQTLIAYVAGKTIRPVPKTGFGMAW